MSVDVELIIKIFSKLTLNDFQNTSSEQYFESQKLSNMSLYDFFINKTLVDSTDIKKDTIELCKKIKGEIFHNNPDNKALLGKNHEISGKKMIINKQKIVNVINNNIRIIAKYDDVDNSDDEEIDHIKQQYVKDMIDDMKLENRPVMQVVQNKRDEYLECWNRCKNMSQTITNNSSLYQSLTKIYHIDSDCVFTDMISMYDISNQTADELHNSIIPKVIYINSNYNCEIKIVNYSSLSACIETPGSILINNGHRFATICEQGIELPETNLYYSSSYNLCINKLLTYIPFKYDDILYMNKVLIFKDHTIPDYPNLRDTVEISVINMPNFIDVDKAPISEQLEIVFKFANMLNYHTIVFDASINVEIFKGILDKYKTLFKTIIFAITDKSKYELFKREL
jgi:hypothetical protein